MEKKLKNFQKLAQERIWRLLELAQKDEVRAKQYLALAVKIAKKANCGLPPEVKKQFCRNCYSIALVQRKEKPFLVVECVECGKEKKYSLEEKSKGARGEQKTEKRASKSGKKKKRTNKKD